MRAEIISVGTELLLGQIVDTNAAYMAQRLAEIGIDVHFKQTVGDNATRVEEALRLAMSRADVVLMTGGLGPTEDDLTVAAVAATLGLDLVSNEAAADHIRRFFETRGRIPSSTVYKQALVPRGAHVIPNDRGTAPGVHIDHRGRSIFMMPGVPYEMKGMMENYVLPALRDRTGLTVIRSRVLRITGEGESAIEERIKDLLQQTDPTVAPYAKLGEVHLRLTAKGAPEEVDAALARGEAQVRERLSDLVYGIDEQTLEDVVAQALIAKNLTLAVAESCTGGLISYRLTNIPGSSTYFLEGVVAYSNEVSAEVAEAMAGAIRRRSGAAVGLGVTGIAGPAGGNPDKPVGLVYLALAGAGGTMHRRLTFGAEAGRQGIRVLAAQAGLNLLRLHLTRA
ncbi:MAG: competence/damage-inducible protein A [Armatimonadetes bacterium 13_1_40CM_3_65_7]|nr:MAG: competence/damage-inducible protein A [Armatimonadetes bacterium 13_1_40CM_3_65_7]